MQLDGRKIGRVSSTDIERELTDVISRFRRCQPHDQRLDLVLRPLDRIDVPILVPQSMIESQFRSWIAFGSTIVASMPI